MYESCDVEFSIGGTMRPGRMTCEDSPEWIPRRYDKRTKPRTPCNLHRVRMGKGLSQSELVFRSGLSQALISNIERGFYLYSRWETVRRIAEGLKMDPTEFADLVGGIRRNNRMFWSGAAVIAYADLTGRAHE